MIRLWLICCVMYLRSAEGLLELLGKKSSPIEKIKRGILSDLVKSYSKNEWSIFINANLGSILSDFAPELEVIKRGFQTE